MPRRPKALTMKTQSPKLPARIEGLDYFWSVSFEEVLRQLRTSVDGLPAGEAEIRLDRYGPNRLQSRPVHDRLSLLVAQFKSPITLILIAAALLSFALASRSDAAIILLIVVVSALLGFWQEHKAADSLRKLLATVTTSVKARRDGHEIDVPLEGIVPGDIVEVSAGSAIPGDCLLLEAKDLFVNEAALTGETYPSDKHTGVLSAETRLAERRNVVYLGTHVESGRARAVVVHTGRQTEFGKVSDRLRLRPPE